ncbi:MAG: hydrolase 2, exosortase A system-associated [Rubrivivax sp.]|nr:hydrolase 2, exosortase A system-associated [Rubrivivax sp.]
MHAPPFEVFFVPAHGGQRLYIHHAPAGSPRGLVLHLPAFAEEMNKSRRMVAQTSRALAAVGFAVLQVDLFGCGDSAGDLGDASWADWTEDIGSAAAWLRTRHNSDAPVPLWLWAHRAGALLAGDALTQLAGPANLLLWQPLLQGRSVVQQMLRLKAAAHWQQGDGKAVIDRARADLAAGAAVEVAGYLLTPALVNAFEQAALKPSGIAGDGRQLVWLETSGDGGEISPAAQAQLPRWQQAGWRTDARAVAGPGFWQTVEIEDAPALVAATVQAMERAAVDAGDAQPAPVAAAGAGALS